MKKYEKKKVCPCLSCHCTKFVPVTTPRYNKYEVNRHVWMADLKSYNDHRKRCFYAQPRVDTKAPHLDISTRLKPLLLYNDVYRAAQIDKENKNFMKRLMKVDRFGGLVDSINGFANMHMSNWIGHKSNMLQIERDNKNIHKRIVKAKSVYKYSPTEWGHFIASLKNSARFPLIIFKKKNLDKEIREQPSISTGFHKISNHLECFMDFTLQNGEYLGRIIVELYQEISPQCVQLFLDFCRKYKEIRTKNIYIQRIVQDRYFESSFITNFKTENERKRKRTPVTYKMKHSRTGTLSMIRDEKRNNNLKLCLTLCPMPELDRKNFVFGKVIMGIDVLKKINGYSRKIGKPLETIIISDCGEMPNCVCHKRMIQCKQF